MKGRLEQWDVMNEPFDNHDLMDLLGKDVMVDWYQEARATDPGAKLFINDYSILSGGGGTSPHRDAYESTIQYLLDKGAPLDGIGMQGHFGNALTAPEDMLEILGRYAKFKKPIFITEYDVVIDDEALAGDFTRDLLTTLFSHPQVGGFLMWGFWDGAHWKKNAPLFHEDFSPKPALQNYKDLVFGKWWTKAQAKTDAKGGCAVRGFLGDYEVEVQKGGKKTKGKAVLGAGGTAVSLVLE
jgi:GH35 family endo-1,4-beta-xylanase